MLVRRIRSIVLACLPRCEAGRGGYKVRENFEIPDNKLAPSPPSSPLGERMEVRGNFEIPYNKL